ncbi:hypothetical protein QW131_29095 [Roseibium salinum]|nr:hypothetical protein [Roseibium salinum]
MVQRSMQQLQRVLGNNDNKKDIDLPDPADETSALVFESATAAGSCFDEMLGHIRPTFRDFLVEGPAKRGPFKWNMGLLQGSGVSILHASYGASFTYTPQKAGRVANSPVLRRRRCENPHQESRGHQRAGNRRRDLLVRHGSNSRNGRPRSGVVRKLGLPGFSIRRWFAAACRIFTTACL